MVNYLFGVLAELTDSAVSNSIPSIAPVNHHASVVGNEVVIHPTIHPTIEATTKTEPAFAVAVEHNVNNENSPPVVPVTVIQDATTSLPVVAPTAIATAASQPFFNPHPALTDSRNTFIDVGSSAHCNDTSSPPSTNTVTPLRPALATIATSNTPLNPVPGTSVSNAYGAAVATAAAVVANSTSTVTDPTTPPHTTSPSTTMVAVDTIVSNPPSSAGPSTATLAASAASTSRESLALDSTIADLKAEPLTTGCARAVNASMCSAQYDRKKKQVLCEFIEALCRHQKYSGMVEDAVDVPDFFPPSTTVAVVFVVLSGPHNKRKKIFVLNKMLIDWIQEKENKCSNGQNNKYPSPATINTSVRTFFAATKELYHWDFSSKDFNFQGGYNAFFKDMCANRQKEDVSMCVSF